LKRNFFPLGWARIASPEENLPKMAGHENGNTRNAEDGKQRYLA
jgi:hypothetical protein